MKKRIFLVGAFSGKNVGDEAILESTLINLSDGFKNAQFYIPTLNVNNLARYTDYDVIPVDISNKGFFQKIKSYLKLIKLIKKSDLILITASLFFEYKLLNLKYNPFLRLLPFILFSKINKKKIGLYSAGVGPIYTPLGKLLIKSMLKPIDFMILREKESVRIAKTLGISNEKMKSTSDIAMITPVKKNKKSISFLDNLKHPILGVNVNFYIDEFVSGKSKLSERKFVKNLSKAVNEFAQKNRYSVCVFDFCPYDDKISNKVYKSLEIKNKKLIRYPDYDHLEFNYIISKMDLFIGMRLHSLVLAYANGVPFISINYASKCKDFLDNIDELNRGIPMQEYNSEIIMKKLEKYKDKCSLENKRLKVKMEESRNKAKSNIELVKKFMKK